MEGLFHSERFCGFVAIAKGGNGDVDRASTNWDPQGSDGKRREVLAMPGFSAEKSLGPPHGAYYQLAAAFSTHSVMVGSSITHVVNRAHILDRPVIVPAQACQGGPTRPPGCSDSCTYSISGCDRTCCVQVSPDQILCGVSHYNGPCPPAPPLPPSDCTTTGCRQGLVCCDCLASPICTTPAACQKACRL